MRFHRVGLDPGSSHPAEELKAARSSSDLGSVPRDTSLGWSEGCSAAPSTAPMHTDTSCSPGSGAEQG